MRNFPDARLAFQPGGLPYIPIGRLSSEIGQDASGKPIMTRQSCELIALTGILDKLIARRNDGGEDFANGPAVFADGSDRLVVHKSAIAPLRDLETVDRSQLTEPVFNVRVRPARVDNDSRDREFLGWHVRLDPEQERLAVTRWWQPPREDMTGRPFVATVSGLCVYVGRIVGYTQPTGRAQFDVDTSDDELKNQWLYRRVQTPPGGNTAILRPLGGD